MCVTEVVFLQDKISDTIFQTVDRERLLI